MLITTTKPRTLGAMLRERVQRHDDRSAFAYLDDTGATAAAWSYGALEARAQASAALLSTCARPGDRVLLLYPPGLDFLAGFWGCLYAGCIGVPVYPPRPRRDEPRLDAIARDCQPVCALTVAGTLPAVRRWAESGIAGSPVACIATDAIDPAARAPVSASPADVAYLQYTSGTTADPRGVMVTHENVLANLAYIDEGFEHDDDSVAVTWLPHFHDMGLVYGLLQPVFNGFRCVSMAPASFVQAPARWLAAISRYSATHSGGPNFAYDLCVQKVSDADAADLNLESWDVAFNGAEPVSADTLEHFSQRFAARGFRASSFYPAYGLAEATLKVSGGRKQRGAVVRAFSTAHLERGTAAATIGPQAVDDARRLVGCGMVSGQTTVVVVRPEDGTEVESGQIGEICVGGDSVAAGYWHRPDQTRTTFGMTVPGRDGTFLRTGDLGFLAGGQLFVTGRSKDLIIVRGRNYYPQDIEKTAARVSTGTRRGGLTAAFGVQVARSEAVVVVQETAHQDRETLCAAAAGMREAISGEHGLAVHAVVFVKRGAVPRTPSGKVRRGYCRELYESGLLPVVLDDSQLSISPDAAAVDDSAEDDADARDRIWRRLRRWSTPLRGVDMRRLERRSSLTAAGVDSLAAAEIRDRLEEELGVRVDVATLLEDRPLADLVDELAARMHASPVTPAEEPSDGPIPQEWPASAEQVRLWLVSRRHPESPAHNVFAALRLEGSLDRDALARALDFVARRHEAIRTRLRARGHSVHQVIEPDGGLPVSWLPAVSARDSVAMVLAQRAALPFDLARGALARAELLPIGPGTHVLMLVLHHAIADGWTVDLLLREAATAYNALRVGESPRLPSTRRSRAVLLDPSATVHRQSRVDYWSRQLANVPLLDLTPPERRCSIGYSAAETERFAIPIGLARELRAVCATQRVTLTAALLTAFGLAIHRESGAADFVLGVPTHGRHRASMRNVAGFMAQLLPVRITVAREDRVGTVLHRVAHTLLAAQRHEVPFADILRALRLRRLPGYPVLVQAMFNAMAPSAIHFDGLRVTWEPVNPAVTEFDFDLTTHVRADGALDAALTYNRDLFDRPLLDRVVRRYFEGLSDLATALDSSVAP